MNSKEFLEKLINDIEEQNEIVSKEPHLIINIKVNAEAFIPLLHDIKQDLEALEIIKKHLTICGLSISCFIGGNPNVKETYEPKFNNLKEWLDE